MVRAVRAGVDEPEGGEGGGVGGDAVAAHDGVDRGAGRFAVNLVALLNAKRDPQHAPLYWLLVQVVTPEVVNNSAQDRLGTAALLVKPEITEERWKAIVKVVQIKFRPEEFPLYEKKAGRWQRVGRRR